MHDYCPHTTADVAFCLIVPDDTIAGLSLRGVVLGYLTCAEWIDLDGSEETPDNWADAWEGWSNAALAQATDDCRDLLLQISAAVPAFSDGAWDDDAIDYGDAPGYSRSERFGHDFWLTRNRHGAGFWDRTGLAEPLPSIYPVRDGFDASPRPDESLGDWLTRLCEPFGECYAYLGDDNVSHLS